VRDLRRFWERFGREEKGGEGGGAGVLIGSLGVGEGLGFVGQGDQRAAGAAMLAQDFLPGEGDDPIGGTGRQ
jgi:hypothetical protein